MSTARAVEAIFAPKGTLSRVLDPFEWRAQQAQMAGAVADLLDHSGVLVVEAPTGVGKSLAYLVPGALWARREGKVLLVSTHTRNLQDQILRRDLPLLRRLTDRKITIAVLKGRANYLCRRRWEIARAELEGTTDGEVLVRTLEGWVQVTESGDLDEAPAIAPRLRGLLPRIASDSHFCATGECSPEDGCFFKLSRKRAREAHVVLVNHTLLVLELLSGRAGLPEWDGLVIDEAHHLPRIAADAMARKVSAQTWRSALLRLGGQGEPGATDLMRRLIRGWPSQVERSRWLSRIRVMEENLGRLLDQSRLFFDGFAGLEGFPPVGGRARYRLGVGSGGPFPEGAYELLDASAGQIAEFDRLLKELSGPLEADDRGRTAAPGILGTVEEARETVATLTFLAEAEESETVYWLENDPAEGVVMRSRPITLGGALGSRLADGRPLVLTSATLAADGTAGFFAAQCGLPDAREELILPPVFDLENQVRVLVPEAIHDPREAGHEVDLADGILRLASALPRKILVLFTAHETLRRVEERIRAPLEDRGIRLYAQGRESSRQALAEAFQASDRAVLLGAASFWEGVDFPGAELEILVMVRLPFPVPSDPFVEAYGERLREEGKDPFESFMLPEAIVRFRQGFGRLIRRREDRGVFAILDPRVLRKGYGPRFTQSLSIPVHSVSSWDALVAEAEGWFLGMRSSRREMEAADEHGSQPAGGASRGSRTAGHGDQLQGVDPGSGDADADEQPGPGGGGAPGRPRRVRRIRQSGA